MPEVSPSNAPRPLVSLEAVTLRVGETDLVPQTSWALSPGENWVVTGANGSGKSSLMRALLGETCIYRGKVVRNHPRTIRETFRYVSFERQSALMKKEALLDEARDYAGQAFGTDAIEFLETETAALPEDLTEVHRRLRIPTKNRKLCHLSAGEMRKLMIRKALAGNPDVLILDEPFDGLDAESVSDFREILGQLARTDRILVLVTHRAHEIPEGFSRRLHIEDDRCVECDIHADFHREAVLQNAPDIRLPELPGALRTEVGEALFRIEKGDVRYDDTVILENVDWTVRKGEHWSIQGPNGAGKSTLLGLVTGRHLQSYANTITLFGRKRGSGESIWDIGRRIGLVSPSLHSGWMQPVTAREVVASGFFDAIGLPRRPNPLQWEQVDLWIDLLGFSPLKDRLFTQLSYGQQRMLLIARAMVKSPDLLLLDEPSQGLDAVNRRRIFALLATLIEQGSTTLVHVTHQPGEHVTGMTHQLSFIPEKKGYRLQTIVFD